MSENTPQIPTGDSFIRERRRGHAQGQRDLFTRAGVKDDTELIALVEAGRRAKTAKPAETPVVPETDGKPASAAPGGKKPAAADGDEPARKDGESLKAFEERFAKYEAAQAKILARFEADDKAREAEKAEREAAEKEAAAEREAQTKYENEVEWFREVAVAADADEKKFGRLLKIWEAELADLTPRAFEKLFGEAVPDEKQAENAKKMLADLRKDHPGLFKAAALAEEKKPPGSTGAPASAPEGSAPASGARAPLDARKLSREQYRQYEANPKLFKERFAQGLIDYPGKK